MSSKTKRRRMIRKARAAFSKPYVGRASNGQPIEAATNLQCYNVTDKSIFVEGLQAAGLNLVPRLFSSGNDPNQVIIVLQTQADARQIVEALHGCRLEGRTMLINILSAGIRVWNKEVQPPKVKYIRRCVSNAFHERAFKEDLARENFEYAAAMQKARTNIKAPKMATKRQKAKKDVPKEEENLVAMGISGSESEESEGLAEEIQKQKGEEERGEMRDDIFRPEASARQHMEVGETKSDLRGERSQIQDTACEGERSHGSTMITSTRSSSPDDMLSALLASLDEGKDAAKGFDMVDNLV